MGGAECLHRPVRPGHTASGAWPMPDGGDDAAGWSALLPAREAAGVPLQAAPIWGTPETVAPLSWAPDGMLCAGPSPARWWGSHAPQDQRPPGVACVAARRRGACGNPQAWSTGGRLCSVPGGHGCRDRPRHGPPWGRASAVRPGVWPAGLPQGWCGTWARRRCEANRVPPRRGWRCSGPPRGLGRAPGVAGAAAQAGHQGRGDKTCPTVRRGAHPAPNKRLQATSRSVRCAPASGRA